MASLKRWNYKEKFILFLLIYCAVTLLYISYKSSDLFHKEKNCNSWNAIILQKENRISKQIENNVSKFLSTYRNDISLTKKWIQITKHTYIFSAYLDRCPSILSLSSMCVKFIGVVLADVSSDLAISNLRCAFDISSMIYRVGYAIIKTDDEVHGTMYKPAFFYCMVRKIGDTLLVPEYATLFLISPEPPWLLESPWLPVYHFPFNSDITSTSVNLCVRPSYGSFSFVHFSVFLAYYSAMGVDNFVFYHNNGSELLQKFVTFLVHNNINVELRLWDIPFNDSFIHSYEKKIFAEDCISRSKYKFSHTLIVHLNEFIVPKRHHTITDLIKYLDSQNQNAGSYAVPVVLFCDEFSFFKSELSPFYVFNHNVRQKTHWYRSKYIFKYDKAQYNDVLYVWEYERNSEDIFVPSSLAVLHRYQKCCGLLQTWFFDLFTFHVLKDKTFIDNSLYKHELKVMSHRLIHFILNPFQQ